MESASATIIDAGAVGESVSGASKAVKGLKKGFGIIGDAMPFASVALQTYLDLKTEGVTAMNLTMDLVGYGAQEALEAFIGSAAVGGPIGAVVVQVFQAVSMLIDTFWSPYASYFNKDLDAMKSQYESAYRYNLAIAASANWPLERKPALIPRDADGNISEAVRAELMEFLKTWYEDHNLISQAEQNEIVNISDKVMARQLTFASYNPTNSFYSEPKKTLVASFMNDNAIIVKLMAYALKKRQGLAIATIPPQVKNELNIYKQSIELAEKAAKKEVQTRLIVFFCTLLCLCLICSSFSATLLSR